ncbi:DUF2961 domain-containing protein, partial [Candidatus Sumerlaeota bacterium]|nr:DUF2961 domain-containing protein [Candidatus Sumerlaeota bacterium]
HVWITAKSVIPQVYGLMVLRIFWDGEETPSVEVPLGDFFGVGFGKERKFQSSILEMYPAGGECHAALNSYWKMPFKKTARFEIENRSFRVISMFFIQIDYEKSASFPDELLYFHAQYRRENPVTLHVPYTILEAKGKGNYIGTIMNYHLLGPGAWVEGGQDFFIDGEQEPSLPGSGAEDYFGHAWGFRFETNGFFHGTSFGPENDKMTAYRFHIPDPVRFKTSIRATMRCHGWDVQDRQDDYSSVALWYQTEPHDKFPELPPPDYDLLEIPPIYRINPMILINEKLKALPFKGENLALNAKDYRESGHFDIDNEGKRAFDNDMGTKWCEITHPDSHWLSLDLGQRSLIEGFVIVSPSAMGDSPGFDLLGFRIDKADSFEGPWETILEKNIKPEDALTTDPLTSVMILPLSKSVKSRFIRLRITDSCALDPICRIQEFQAWGKKE